MKAFQFLCACFLFALILETGLYAQPKPSSCSGSQAIWIKRKNSDKYLDGDRSFVRIEKGVLYFCVASDLSAIEMKDVLEIRFAKPSDEPKVIVYTGTRERVIPNQKATLPAAIKPPITFDHPTMSGTVILRLVVDEEGKVASVTEVGSTNWQLNELAKTKAWNLKFSPAMKDGKAATVEEYVALSFTTSNPNPKTLAPLRLLSPQNNFPLPRTVTPIEWETVPGTISYKIQVICSQPPGWNECHSERVPASQTKYNLKLLDQSPFKLRIVAELRDGREVASEWGIFGYRER